MARRKESTFVNILGVTSQTWFPIVTLIVGALLKATFDRFSDHE
jgi:hypothetical protein